MKKSKSHDKTKFIKNFSDNSILKKKELAILNFELQLFKNSEILFKEILYDDDKDLESYYYLGIIHALRGDLITSLSYYSSLLKIYPNFRNPFFFNNYANALKQTGDYANALEYYKNAIEIDGSFIDAYFNSGLLLVELGRVGEALISFEKVLSIDPNHTEALFFLGKIFNEKKQYLKAINYFKNVVKLNINFAEAYFELALISQEINFLDDSLQYYYKLIELDPNNYHAFYNLGNLCFILLKYEESLKYYDCAIRLNSNFADLYSNRGNVLVALKRWNDALHSYESAIAIDNSNKVFYFNLGNLYQELMIFEKSLSNYDIAIHLDSNYHQAIFNKSLVLLLNGNFELGWNLFEHRPNRPLPINESFINQYFYLQPSYFINKNILILSEQGLGDTIQFCRYAILLKNIGAKVTLEVDESLLDLLKNLFDIELIIKNHHNNFLKNSYDFHIPLLSLPYLFGTRLDSIPFNISYLSSTVEKRKYWDRVLGPKTTFRIGIAWSGNAAHKNDVNRSIGLENFICKLPRNFQYISLQKDIRETDKQFLQIYGIKDLSSYIYDFTDTAALCDLMDIIISVDTSIAHLAGAIGKNTLLLVPFIPDWRWLLNRDDSPWYKSMRIYRQDKNREWETVFDQISEDLINMHR